MNREQFRKFAHIHGLELADAGRDWHDAGYNGAYLVAVITNKEELEQALRLVSNEQAYLASGEIKAGQQWYYHNGGSSFYGDDAHQDMAERFIRFLSESGNFSYYSEEDIAERDKALATSPAEEDEDEDDHLQRVADASSQGWLCPLYVDKAGYWMPNGEELMLSDEDMSNGVYSYRYDNWREDMLLVLKEDR